MTNEFWFVAFYRPPWINHNNSHIRGHLFPLDDFLLLENPFQKYVNMSINSGTNEPWSKGLLSSFNELPAFLQTDIVSISFSQTRQNVLNASRKFWACVSVELPAKIHNSR